MHFCFSLTREKKQNKTKQSFWTKITKKLRKPAQYMYQENVFHFLAFFLSNFLNLKILAKKALKITVWPKFQIFDQKKSKHFQK